MRRSIFLILFLLIVPGLLLLYQNAGELGPDAPKPLQFPRYFASIYEEQKQDTAVLRSPESLTQDLWRNSPLYKSLNGKLNDKTVQEDPPCDPKKSDKICPQDGKNKPQNEHPLTLAVDPLRTLATVRMDDTWEGRIRYDSPQGPTVNINKQLSQDSRLLFEMQQPTSSGRISIDIAW